MPRYIKEFMKVASGPAARRRVNFSKYVDRKTTVARYRRYRKEISTYHGENLQVLVCKLVAEVIGQSDTLDSTLEGGLGGIAPASGSGGSRD